MPRPTPRLLVGLALAGLAVTGPLVPGALPGAAASAPAVAAAAAPSGRAPSSGGLAFATGAAARPTPVAAPTAPSSVSAPTRVSTVVTDLADPATRTARSGLRAASTCRGDGWEQRRGAAAMRALRPAAATDYSVSFHSGRSGFLGLTRPGLRAIEVYVRSCSAQSDELLVHVLAHELGHARDKTRLTDAQRRAWKDLRGIPQGTPWFGCSRCTDFATPAGDFAEVYAQWRRGATDNRSELAGAPSPAELEELARRFFGAPAGS